MKVKKGMPLLISLALLGTAVCLSAVTAPERGTQQPVQQPIAATADTAPAPERQEEMRGVWVTYMELSMEYEEDKSETAFREKFTRIADTCKRFGYNTLVAHVRPFCDALYYSDYFPASHVLTGVQGEAADYDALAVMCEICRDFGLRLHAWINPYRVSVNDTPSELCADHVFLTHPGMCLETESGVILDPANKAARELIENGVREIVERYDVDGIQFDDYFYPTDTGSADAAQYEAYLTAHPQSRMTLTEWREMNVNLLLSEVCLMIRHSGKNVVFGISPQGHLANNEALAADVVSWCTVRGYADYICPQLYFSPDNPQLGFADALADWTALDFADDVTLYAGLAGYKAATDADEGTWEDSGEILADEYRMLRQDEGCGGVMLYSYSALEDESKRTEMEALSDAFRQFSDTAVVADGG